MKGSRVGLSSPGRMVIQSRQVVYHTALVGCAVTAAVILLGWIISYARPIIWEHTPLLGATGGAEFRLIGGAFYVGWSNYGVGYVPCAIPFIILAAWPVVVLVLSWTHRRRRPRFPIK